MKQFFKNVAVMLLLPFAFCLVSGIVQFLIALLCALPLWAVILIMCTCGVPLLFGIFFGGVGSTAQLAASMVKDSLIGKIMCAIGCAYAVFYNTTHLIAYIQEVNMTGIENPRIHIVLQSVFGVSFVIAAIVTAVMVFKSDDI